MFPHSLLLLLKVLVVIDIIDLIHSHFGKSLAGRSNPLATPQSFTLEGNLTTKGLLLNVAFRRQIVAMMSW